MGRELEASRSQRYQMLHRWCGTPFNRGVDLRAPFMWNESSLDVDRDFAD